MNSQSREGDQSYRQLAAKKEFARTMFNNGIDLQEIALITQTDFEVAREWVREFKAEVLSSKEEIVSDF